MTTETMVSVRDEARALAAEYLRRFCGDAIPVDPVPLATLLGVRVKQTDLPPDGRPDTLLLASAFRVSEDAMRYRLRGLGWT